MTLSTLEYIWIDGQEPVQKLRSKTKVAKLPALVELSTFKKWNYDGSSTNQSEGGASDLILSPVSFCKDPLREGDAYLILCEVQDPDGMPHRTNTRSVLMEAIGAKRLSGKSDNTVPWIGFEQEYTLMASRSRPLGFPKDEFCVPSAQGPYYCGVGAKEAFGREIAEEHLMACLKAELPIYGINAEVMPGQWEFQIGPRCSKSPLGVLQASDALWLARYILHRIGEKHGINVTLDCKPVKGDWNGSGMHTNFSTPEMRAENGLEAIFTAIKKLEPTHEKHISVYGSGLENRLTGLHETCDINTFKSGNSDRGASIRIPNHVFKDKKGYLEDRRPGANADPYLVAEALIQTIC
jgi:glutamine synthetase